MKEKKAKEKSEKVKWASREWARKWMDAWLSSEQKKELLSLDRSFNSKKISFEKYCEKLNELAKQGTSKKGQTLKAEWLAFVADKLKERKRDVLTNVPLKEQSELFE